MSYLGLDLGTSGLRALLTDAAGAVLGESVQGYGASHPRPGWSEQDPQHWIDALEAAVADLAATCPAFADLDAIAVAGHMHGATLLDRDGTVIRPCILWNDTRAHREAARLDAMDDVRELSGNIVFPGFTAPKLDWLRTHEPGNFARVSKAVLPATYLNLYLTGEAVCDMSDASGTAWLDVGARAWSEPLLRAGHMTQEQMPRLVEGSAVAGHLRADLARRWGLRPGITVAGGAGDNAAAACGIGALHDGQGFVSLGTSGVVLVARDGFHPAPGTALHSFCHAVPGRWYQMGVMLAATDCLNWLSRITGETPAGLTGALGPELQAPGRLRFLPYLSGERTPHNDAGLRGGFHGLGIETDRRDLTRAVLEGVAFGLRDCADALARTGARPASLFVIGGGAASTHWVEMLATVLDTPLHRVAGGAFGVALGAARLARVAATGAAPETVMQPPRVSETIAPRADLVDAFAEAHAAFRALALRDTGEVR